MKFIWPDSARAELRAIDREAAVRILRALTLYARTGEGDLKALSGRWEGYFRLRVGEYRVISPCCRTKSQSGASGIGPTFTDELLHATVGRDRAEGGNREDALDLSQDVFLKAYQNLRKLDDPARFGPWLYRIAQ